MTKLLLACATWIAVAAALHAQNLQVTAAEYTARKLFDSTVGFTITGLAADSNGDVYYLETDASFPPAAATTLFKRTVSSGYTIPTPLFSYAGPAFGAFVALENGTIYFGESSSGTIRAMNRDGSAMRTLGSVAGIYDMAFSMGQAFVSANPETDFAKPPRNTVYHFDLISGATDAILGTGDYSGPIEFDGTGRLLYGASGVAAIRDLHAFSPAEISSAFGPMELALAPPSHRILQNGANVYLAFAGGTFLWEDDFSSLTVHELGGPASQTVATSSDALGHLDFAAGQLFTNVTSFAAGRSAVYAVQPIPEPSVGAFLIGTLIIFLRPRLRAFARLR